jgi:hypothetical protein
MGENPEASGRAFLGLIRHIKDAHGPDVLREIVNEASAETRAVFATPIKVMGWYPYPALVGFLGAAERRLGKGQPYCRELGAVAGRRDLGTIFRIYRALASPEHLIRACHKVWPSYYRNAGEMVAVSWSPDDTLLRILDFPKMHPHHCRLMEGWMAATMENIGVRIGPGARETECPCRGGRYHEFRCTWSK